MKQFGKVVCSWMIVALLAVPGAALAQDDAGPPTVGRNVRLTLSVVDSDPGDRPAERVYDFLAQDGGGPAKLLMGWRVPIPTAKGGADESGKPKTEYVYQNIGFTASVMVHVLQDGRIAVRGEIEASGVRKGPLELRASEGGSLPIIGTFQQSLSVTVRPGEVLRVAEVPEPERGRLYLSLSAEILE